MVLNSCYCWNASHRQPQSHSGLHFHRGRSFPTYFEWNDSWVQTIHRTANDYLTVQNQVVTMGTSFGEVTLNRSNLKKQKELYDRSETRKFRQPWKVWKRKHKEVSSYYHGIHSKRNLDYNKTLLIVHVLSDV